MSEHAVALYLRVAYACAEKLTKAYSTSFSISIYLLEKDIRPHIYAVYGMVRLADEIVDTFEQDKKENLAHFRQETVNAVDRHFSSNPVLHAFQNTFHTYGLGWGQVEAFFTSMEMDLVTIPFTKERFDKYVYGSAECIGLMCLPIFLRGDYSAYRALEAPARQLGAGYQKLNFLRDIRSDFEERKRSYFPGIDPISLTNEQKAVIEQDIRIHFTAARLVLPSLPPDAAQAVGLSISYYEKLLEKISHVSARQLMKGRIRVSKAQKARMLIRARLGLR